MRKILLVIPLLLIACTVPVTPAQTVYAIQGTYAVALKAEVLYSNYPRCNGRKFTFVRPCSEVSVIREMQKADDAAWIAIREAQTVVRAPNYSNRIQAVLSNATALTTAFKGITEIYVKD